MPQSDLTEASVALNKNLGPPVIDFVNLRGKKSNKSNIVAKSVCAEFCLITVEWFRPHVGNTWWITDTSTVSPPLISLLWQNGNTLFTVFYYVWTF